MHRDKIKIIKNKYINAIKFFLKHSKQHSYHEEWTPSSNEFLTHLMMALHTLAA